VWKAWTEPERLATWWGPHGWSTSPADVTMDVRPGGIFRVSSARDDDGSEMTTEGVYREVLEPERLVLEEAGEGNWHEGAVSIVTLTDLGEGRTEMVFRATIETTEEMIRSAESGLGSAFDRLADSVESR
jgi:uncharacterized protein YndB with AHSA1/START domain